MRFDPDALLGSLPLREIKQVGGVRPRAPQISEVLGSSLGQAGEYNGFTKSERNRTARLSGRLVQLGATTRPSICDICGSGADDEHAENYYDLSRWIGLCKPCHRHALHNRFKRPLTWATLLDRYELPDEHWTRRLPMEPFDLAQLLRDRGAREPKLFDFVSD